MDFQIQTTEAGLKRAITGYRELDDKGNIIPNTQVPDWLELSPIQTTQSHLPSSQVQDDKKQS